MRRGKKQARRTGRPSLSARLISQVRLEARAGGEVVACFEDHSLDLGTFSTAAAQRAESLRAGLPLRAFASRRSGVDEEIHRLLRRLAGHGLLEYRLTRSANGADAIVIEPQTPDYWPQTAPLCDGEVLAFSRFAYLRRRGNDMVLESPRAGALFRICDPDIAAALATLATPRPVKELRRRKNFPADALLALLLDCQILFKVGRARDGGMRPAEGDASLVLWDFHDLLFHARSTQGRHANPIGGVYPYADVVPALPAVRPLWPGKKIDLHRFAAGEAQVGDAAAAGVAAALAAGLAGGAAGDLGEIGRAHREIGRGRGEIGGRRREVGHVRYREVGVALAVAGDPDGRPGQVTGALGDVGVRRQYESHACQ